jgi:general secretion pathway protein H
MLDMVVTMALISLFILLALPAIPHGTGAFRLAGYAAQTASLLKATRSRAIEQARDVGLVVDLARKQFVGSAGSLTLPNDVMLDVVASATCRDGLTAIVFAADGRSCGAIITLAKEPVVWRIRVNWLTGFIDVLSPSHG